MDILNSEVYQKIEELQRQKHSELKQNDLLFSKQLSMAFDALTNSFQKFKVENESWPNEPDPIPKRKNRRKKNRKKAKAEGTMEEPGCNGNDRAQDDCGLKCVDDASDNEFDQ